MSQEQLTHPYDENSRELTPAFLALESFLLDGQSRNLAERTLYYYRQQLTWFIGYVGADVPPKGLTATHIRDYLVHLQQLGWKSSSQAAAARAIRTFYSFLVNDDWIPQSPMAKVRMPKVDAEIKPAGAANRSGFPAGAGRRRAGSGR